MTSRDGSRRDGAGKAREDGGQLAPAVVARQVADDLAELLGREPEGVVSLERTEEGWRVGLEVVETRRVPDTADVIAEYEVDANNDGQLVGYRRARRYTRGQVRDDR